MFTLEVHQLTTGKKFFTYWGKLEKVETFGKISTVLLFGSNKEGRHRKGMALIAYNHFGAKLGQARGMQGNGYAIVTKDLRKKIHPSVSLLEIKKELIVFYDFVKRPENKQFIFIVPYKANELNLNYYSPMDMCNVFINDMFEEISDIPKNVIFETDFFKLSKFKDLLT